MTKITTPTSVTLSFLAVAPLLATAVLSVGCATKQPGVAQQTERQPEEPKQEPLQPSRASRKVRAQAIADIAVLEMALDSYAANHAGKYPESLVALVTPDLNGHRTLNQSNVPRDPWNREYVYECGTKPIVKTLGADGKPGGSGDDSDIDSLSIVNGR